MEETQLASLRAYLEKRKKELTEEANRLLAPYQAALGEVEKALKVIEEEIRKESVP